MTKLVTILIGPPCSGKSTYLKSINYDFVISSDDIVEILCRRAGIHYHDFFKQPSNSPIKKQHKDIFNQLIIESRKFEHVVWDLTNLTKKSRQQIIKYYSNALFNAAVFEVNNNIDVLYQRNKNRLKTHGKWIDEKVIKDMVLSYQPVTPSEGFDSVKLVNVV